MKNFKEILESDRLVLKLLEPTFENSKLLYDKILANKEHFYFLPLLYNMDTKTPEFEYDFLKSAEQDRKQQKQYVYHIFIDNELAGTIDIHDIDIIHQKGDIGYWVLPKFEKQGIITEALKLIEEEVFTEDGLNRLSISAATKNIKSNNVAIKNNYHLDGCMRDYFSHGDRGFIDMNIYSKLRKEFIK
jgi:ribosomal-protein-serine acetyltransferase